MNLWRSYVILQIEFLCVSLINQAFDKQTLCLTSDRERLLFFGTSFVRNIIYHFYCSFLWCAWVIELFFSLSFGKEKRYYEHVTVGNV